MDVEGSDEKWADIPAVKRFGFLWPALVDLLREMEVPFVLTAQFTADDVERPTAFHLVPGMDPRIVFAAILAKEGTAGLSKMIPGMGKMEKVNMAEPEGQRKFAELEAGDMRMEHIQLPIFMDSMRDLEEPSPEEDPTPDPAPAP